MLPSTFVKSIREGQLFFLLLGLQLFLDNGAADMQHEHEAESEGMQESHVFLAGQPFSKDEQENLGIIYKWLDDIMWTELWDQEQNRQLAFSQLEQLASVASTSLPALAFAVGQSYYSYFWFKENGPELDIDVAVRSVNLHEIALNYSSCNDLTMGVGTFLSLACTDRWFFLIMLAAEIGAELATRRTHLKQAGELLQKADTLFHSLNQYPFFSFRNWKSVYDMNTNSHLFTEGVAEQKPLWRKDDIPLARWLEANAQVFKDDLEFILENNLFDTLYFAGHVSMTQFSPRRESWAPLNLIHNRELSKNACQVASRSCELLLSRPEIARCNAKDVGAAFARLQPGMGIKPHFWSAPPRLGVHLGLKVPPGSTMYVGDKSVEWKDGEAIVFDDTYIHSVQHKGIESRYLLIAWFCHPCDDVHSTEPVQYPDGICRATR